MDDKQKAYFVRRVIEEAKITGVYEMFKLHDSRDRIEALILFAQRMVAYQKSRDTALRITADEYLIAAINGTMEVYCTLQDEDHPLHNRAIELSKLLITELIKATKSK